MKWLAMDIGCLECGEPSGVVGVFATEEEATLACEAAAAHHKADWHGEHCFDVFDLDDPSSLSKYALDKGDTE